MFFFTFQRTSYDGREAKRNYIHERINAIYFSGTLLEMKNICHERV